MYFMLKGFVILLLEIPLFLLKEGYGGAVWGRFRRNSRGLEESFISRVRRGSDTIITLT